MRIPVTQADWPLAFNKIAKYIGRHWPTGKQPLNKSREITAVLFGYHSVHDVQQELVNVLPDKSYSESAMIKSMMLRSLTKYHLRPDQVLRIFSKAPIKELCVYSLTDEAKHKAWEALQKALGRPQIFMDEYHLFNNYKSPNLLIDLYDQHDIPVYQYAVDQNGNIFQHTYLESFINHLDVNAEDLRELEFTGTAKEFLHKFVLPLAWRPLKEAISHTNHRSEQEWKCPYMVKVENLSNGRFALFHEGVYAYYPASFDKDQLSEALISIYKNQPVTSADIANIEVSRNTKYTKGEMIPENGTGVFLQSGKYFEGFGQTFIRVKPIQSYQDLLLQSWVKDWFWPGMNEYVCQISNDVLEDGIEFDHVKIEHWLRKNSNLSLEIKKVKERDSLHPIFAFLYRDYYSDLDSLKGKGYLSVDRYDGMTDEDFAEAQLELDIEIAELISNGARVRKFHPELSAYFDNAALGFIHYNYEDQRTKYGCHDRDVNFLLSVFGQRISQVSGAKTKQYYPLSIALMDDLLTGKLTLADINDAWRNGCRLLSLYERQDSTIRKLKIYSDFKKNQDKNFVSHGPIAELTRKSSSEILNDGMRTWRKVGTKPMVYEQTIEMFKAKEPLKDKNHQK